MTNQQIIFSGLTRFVHTCLGLICELWMFFYLYFAFIQLLQCTTFYTDSTKINQIKGKWTLKFNKLDPDRCVQSVLSLKNKSVGLSCCHIAHCRILLQWTTCSRQASLVQRCFELSISSRNILYTAEESCTFGDKRHMTNQQIYMGHGQK